MNEQELVLQEERINGMNMDWDYKKGELMECAWSGSPRREDLWNKDGLGVQEERIY